MEKLAEETFVLAKPKKYTRTVAEKVFQNARMYPQITLESDNTITAYNITCSGLGVSFVSDILIRNRGREQDVAYYKLPSEYSGQDLSFGWKAGRYLTRAMQEFLKISRRICEEQGIKN